jgi:hypothetical protein
MAGRQFVEPPLWNPPQSQAAIACKTFEFGKTSVATTILKPQQLDRAISFQNSEDRMKTYDPL